MTITFLTILKLALALGLLIVVTLAGVHLTGQTRISRSIRNSLVIVVRLTFLFVAAFYVLCVVCGLSDDWFVGLVLVTLILSPAASLEEDSFASHLPADAIGFVVYVLILGPVFVVKQFGLGFPERDLMILSPPRSPNPMTFVPEADLPSLDQEMVKVVATLRPIGKIEHNGKRYDATSFDGTMIDIGQSVQVCELRQRMYFVRTIQN